MKRTLQAAGGVVALYTLVRGIAELFLIDYGDPASYREDWGGPSLPGVLAVHTGPGLAVVLWASWWLCRHRRHSRPGTLSRS